MKSIFELIKSFFRMDTPDILKGDGTWPFTACIDGADIVVENVLATCFGGDSDPQDSGETASGINTRRQPGIAGCALPMNTPATSVLRGSPLPRVPWKTLVEVSDGNMKVTVPVIDLGPGKQASKKTGPAHAIDLTIAAAREFDPKASATNFSRMVSFRILGGAKFCK